MKNIDISILKEKPLKDVKAKLILEPLAPLSMVSELPGSYYKSLMYPSKKMICGLFENILGWHFDVKLRKTILNEMQNHRGEIPDYQSGSTFRPLLIEYFDLEDNPIIRFDSMCFYDDLWARSHSRRDSPREHYKRCRHIDSNILSEWNKELDIIINNQDYDEKEKKEVRNEANKKYIAKFPFFYPVLPTRREYITLENGSYLYNAVFDKKLYGLLTEQLSRNNIAYLGNSEGWVNIRIEEI